MRRRPTSLLTKSVTTFKICRAHWIVRNRLKVASAISRYTKVVAELKEKAENYKKAVEKNIEVVKSF